MEMGDPCSIAAGSWGLKAAPGPAHTGAEPSWRVQPLRSCTERGARCKQPSCNAGAGQAAALSAPSAPAAENRAGPQRGGGGDAEPRRWHTHLEGIKLLLPPLLRARHRAPQQAGEEALPEQPWAHRADAHGHTHVHGCRGTHHTWMHACTWPHRITESWHGLGWKEP